MKHLRFPIIFLFTTLFVAPLFVAAEGISEIPSQSVENDESAERLLPFNPAIRRDRLGNGMEYFLLEHPYPEDTVVLRLVVDAGSVLEADRQAGLAHFVEHMAFNGTEDFDETELVAYLERLGMRFGPDVNAYTSFDETVYKLEVPAGDPEALETGFHVMQQWAYALTMDPEAIDRERGVIVEEWRLGQSASQRILRQHVPVLFAGSRYTERLPIGDMEIVRNAPPSDFVDFYRRWYRPDNMAFIAVGDIRPDRLEALVRRHLGPIPRPAAPLNRPYYFVPPREGTRVSIATDTEAQRSTVSFYILDEPEPFETVDDYRALLTRSLFATVVNERLRDLTRDPESPMTGGGIGWNRFLRGTDIAVASAVVRGDAVLGALEMITREIERAKRYGILPSELERAKERFMQSIDEARVNYESRPADSLADELVRYWTEGEAVPGIAEEHRLYGELLPGIGVGEVNAVAGDFARTDNRIVLASLRVTGEDTLPGGGAIPSESELLETITRVEGETLERWDAALVPDTLIDAQSVLPGTVVSQQDHPEVETEELTLSNGMRVYLRPTTLREDEILFTAYSPGGLALVPDGLVAAAELAPAVALASGVGEIDAATLEKVLSGRSVELAAAIGRAAESMSGSSRKEDLELLFQLINLAFTAPRFEETQLQNVKQQTIQSIEGALASPQGRFGRRLQELFAAGDPRLRSPRIDEVEDVELADIEEIYRERFSDPADFALFFVGSFDPETVRDLAERYLAGIPRPSRTGGPGGNAQFIERVDRETAHATPRPVGIVSEELRAGREPVGRYVGVIHGPYTWSREENHRFNSVGDLLDIRLRERIREEAGGSYSIGAGGWRWRFPEPWAYMQIAFGMDPARRDELIGLAYEVVEEVRSTTAGEDYLERIKAQQAESYRQSLQQNGYWLSTLSFFVQHGRDLADIPRYPELIESLTAEDIRRTAERYLDPERRIELILVPESDAAP